MSKRWIEAFRIGGKASRGIKPEHLAEVVADDFDANPRAICFGHPKSDDPAAGQISGAKVEGNSLFVEVANLTTKAVDGIKSGEWLNRSAAFFDPTHEANPRPGKWTLRHLGLLGAAAPGIPNMTPLKQALAFDADGELVIEGDPADAVVYSGAPTPLHFIADSPAPTQGNVTMELTAEQIAENARLKTERDQLDADKAAFAASQRTAIETANAATVDGLVTSGKVLPAEADGLKLVFNALGTDTLEFSATDKTTAAAKLATFLSTAIGKRVPIGESSSPSGEFTADDANKLSSGDITAKARKLMADDAGLTFEAAVEKVSGGGVVTH